MQQPRSYGQDERGAVERIGGATILSQHISHELPDEPVADVRIGGATISLLSSRESVP